MYGAAVPAALSSSTATASTMSDVSAGVPIWIGSMILFCLVFVALAVGRVIREMARTQKEVPHETGERAAGLRLVSAGFEGVRVGVVGTRLRAPD